MGARLSKARMSTVRKWLRSDARLRFNVSSVHFKAQFSPRVH